MRRLRWWGFVVALAVGGSSLGLAPVYAAAKKEAKRSEQQIQVRTTKPKASAPRKAVKGKASVKRKAVVAQRQAIIPARPTHGQLAGLHRTDDPLDLKSNVALVMDQETNEVLLAKNEAAVLPIASITKLMTALVVSEAQQDLDEVLTISSEDIDTEKHTGSRLAVGTRLTRGELMHLALMSSENRAANALGRHYPGGLQAAVAAMNQKARQLGMADTRYVEPTGLSSANQSSASDLARLVKVAYEVPLLRELSTSTEHKVRVGRRDMAFRTTNGLVRSPTWDIGLQKTGYIAEAGRCLVMQAEMAGRKLILVFLDSAGKYSRIGDAERVRRWLSTHRAG
ncbi:D-alanyl-D-alanine endopeptidase (penicillin-binding protein 7) [Inhella inkyongensis]|uniref:D-alanyl-D-alanine endopeptidase (Penicillin-binding protein 7) n=1 Tax=Inhella inkyongensis TaxID=392593 RepID=A0A840S0E2_9BURK|nr:serine hydrolase [Inhella inkyongensis]MBB5203725.1 D-alanyl-D-alanine endopeptidase (penicillin-binding protein 7) [Inhella inkyongensis]